MKVEVLQRGSLAVQERWNDPETFPGTFQPWIPMAALGLELQQQLRVVWLRALSALMLHPSLAFPWHQE